MQQPTHFWSETLRHHQRVHRRKLVVKKNTQQEGRKTLKEKNKKQGKGTSLLWCPACFGTALVSVCLQTSLVAELILPQTQVRRSGSRPRNGGTSNHQGKKNRKRSVRRAVKKNRERWKGTSDNVWMAERYTRSPKGTGFFKAPAKTSRVPTLGFLWSEASHCWCKSMSAFRWTTRRGRKIAC